MKKTKASRPTMGAFITIDERGFVREVLLIAGDEQQQDVVVGALARISRQTTWAWLKRLIKH